MRHCHIGLVTKFVTLGVYIYVVYIPNVTNISQGSFLGFFREFVTWGDVTKCKRKRLFRLCHKLSGGKIIPKWKVDKSITCMVGNKKL